MIRVSKITGGVKRVLRQNMGLRAGEALIVITDTPTDQEWRSQDIEKLEDMVSRNLLARNIADIARRGFPKSEVTFQTYPSTGRSSREPSREVEESMRLFNVVLAATTYSISHTDARESASRSGVRIASMPGVLEEMFYPRGSVTADHDRIASETLALTRILTRASKIKIQTLAGTDLTMNLGGRQGLADTGLYTEPGSWGNLPAGEAYLAPVEGTAEGIVIVQRGWVPNLRHNMKLLFEKGRLVRLSGGGSIGEDLLELLRPGDNRDPYGLRRNLAEFGIGTNPYVRRRDNTLEAEKIRGTVHVAIGDNSHMGGRVRADVHQDFIVPSPTVEVDGRVLMEKGKLDARYINSYRHIL